MNLSDNKLGVIHGRNLECTGLCVALYTIDRRFRYKSLVLSSLVRCGLKQVLL